MLPIFRKRVWVALGAVVLAATTTRAAAQQPVTVTGRITSEAGSPVEGAVVSIRSLSIGASTRADGGYELVVPGSNVSGQSVVLDVRRIGQGVYRAVPAPVVTPVEVNRRVLCTKSAHRQPSCRFSYWRTTASGRSFRSGEGLQRVCWPPPRYLDRPHGPNKRPSPSG